MATRDAPVRLTEAEAEAFYAWFPDDLDFRVAVRRDHGRWYALAQDFDITAVGDTLKDAIVDLDGLVRGYLETYFRQGQPFEESLRPIPRRLSREPPASV